MLDVTCKTVANMIKGKTPEEIRKTFNIKNDFTPEEEETVRKCLLLIHTLRISCVTCFRLRNKICGARKSERELNSNVL